MYIKYTDTNPYSDLAILVMTTALYSCSAAPLIAYTARPFQHGAILARYNDRLLYPLHMRGGVNIPLT